MGNKGSISIKDINQNRVSGEISIKVSRNIIVINVDALNGEPVSSIIILDEMGRVVKGDISTIGQALFWISCYGDRG